MKNSNSTQSTKTGIGRWQNVLLLIVTGTFIAGLVSCKQKTAESQTEVRDSVIEKLSISPLEPGEIFYKDKQPFGATIELAGTQLEADTVIFKINEPRMLVSNDHLIIKNARTTHPFMCFRLPDMKFMGYSGKTGPGPDEFLSPDLFQSVDTSMLCYAIEKRNQKIYRYEKDGRLVYENFKLSNDDTQSYSDMDISQIAPGDFIYSRNTNNGKSIFRSTRKDDSTAIREVYNLGLNPKRKSWTNYIGDFVVNPGQNRMAYAYKYFKIIKFMDLEGQTVRTINFEKEEFDESSTYKVNGLDQNVTHYWGACAGEKYVYFLYSGRTPVEVGRQNSKQQPYIFVEQYDWNGNPIHCYRLDRWGYFTVDEKNKQIYLASHSDDDPFFVFQLKE